MCAAGWVSIENHQHRRAARPLDQSSILRSLKLVLLEDMRLSFEKDRRVSYQ
jgi:hypothetical protein